MAAEHSSRREALPPGGLLPIRTVSTLTGVNPVTLRAWERRYGLIKPVRTPKGHRLYTMADVDLIKRIVALLDGGMSIGQVDQVLCSDQAPSEGEIPLDPWDHYQQRLIQAIAGFDEASLNALYNEALSLYPIDIVTTRLIVPLLRELGRRWETAQGGVAEEHFFSVFMRNKLGARFHHRNRETRGPKLLAACMPGEHHEVGILLFTLAALDHDYRVILLGANTPLQVLPAVVERAACRAIVLAGSAEVPAAELQEFLPRLVAQTQVPVFVGGQVTIRYPQELAASGAVSLGDDIPLALSVIEATLRRH
jgi:DNA-binding transcriptional MerR regulator